MGNKAIDKMTIQEMAQEILINLKERKGTEAELKVSLRDCMLLRAIASEVKPTNSGNTNCAIPDVNQQRELLITAFTEADRKGYIELLTNAEIIAYKVIRGNL